MDKLDWVKRTFGLFLLCAATAIALPAQTFTTLFSFNGTDGVSPFAGLVQSTGGNFYGTTMFGGADRLGTVFKITPSGTHSRVYSFCSQANCADGQSPEATLVEGNDGNFYGTTPLGGANSSGTVFKITPDGTLTTLYNFCSQTSCADGADPVAALVQAADGNFYGTTQEGGANLNCNEGSAPGCGTVFRITPSGALTTLHSFCAQIDCPDGSLPKAALIQANNGILYGTTSQGGSGNRGPGTVFRITTSGTLTTLRNFDHTNGALPDAALIQATDGNFYGVTFGGGVNSLGTVFRITPSGTLTSLHSFNQTDGAHPGAALVQATDGNFYGTTPNGGANNSAACPTGCGTAFQITPSGTLTTLYNFCSQSSCTDGLSSVAPLIQDTNGNFYGTTVGGGAHEGGTVFSLSVGLGPFVEPQPAAGKVGKVVNILGTNLTGATSVTFNGTPAVFKVVVGSLITATVPAGATTGTVQVVTPGGTLSSNVPFLVRP